MNEVMTSKDDQIEELTTALHELESLVTGTPKNVTHHPQLQPKMSLIPEERESRVQSCIGGMRTSELGTEFTEMKAKVL